MRNKNQSTNKNFNSKSSTILSSVKPCLILFMIVIVMTGPISAINLPVIDIASAQQPQQPISIEKGDNESITLENTKNITKYNKKEVFHTLSSISSSAEGNDFSSSSTNDKTSNNTMHKIEMVVISLPTGQPAYKMISHVKSNGSSSSEMTSSNNNNIDLTPKYSKLATIPGPALVFTEGDHVKVNIKDKDGNLINSEEFLASQPGTFLYIDDSKSGENGLFGAVIVNPQNNLTTGLIKGKIQELPLNKLDKDIIMFMVGSTFWGMEIDNHNNYKQNPLWTNPTLSGVIDQKMRFHILGVGHAGNPSDHQHTFHLHAHRWIDPGTNNIIDVKKIIPGKTHHFIIDVGEGVGPGHWQYHCHVFAHMEAGMMGGFNVVSGDPTINIPSESGASPYKNFAAFELTDEPAKWFTNLAGDITNTGTESLAVINKTGSVNFMMSDVSGVHTVTSFIYPTGAMNMPFDEITAYAGGGIVQLDHPGLYVFGCKLHPFMLGAVIADDPTTDGLDLGDEITLINGVTVPTSSDLATRLLKAFFTFTATNNWQDYTSAASSSSSLPNPWHLSYPDVDVRITNGTVVNLKDTLESRYGQNLTLDELKNPDIPGVGEVWVDTQFEKTASKSKPGTASAINASVWEITKKVALPEINMNNAHNMWTDKDQNLIYATQWFDNKTSIFDRNTGKLVKNIEVGDDPSHVMTSTKTDELMVALHGEQGVAVLSPKGESIKKIIPMQFAGQDPSHPHGHWMSGDDRYMVTPDEFTGTATIYDMMEGNILGKVKTGHSPIAIGMTPDGSKSYVADLFDSTISVVDTTTATLIKTINLLENYDPISGNVSGPLGFLPIQTPVSPDGQYMVTANTGSGTITIIDTETDELVKDLSCSAGCHGVNFGAKKNGGYYAYVSSSFSNDLIIVDGDPNNDGDPRDAEIAGRISLVGSPETQVDDKVTALPGTGGMGVLPIPIIYNGWVQNLPEEWKSLLTEEQQNPGVQQ
ncbi:MAG TPA: beta-propeller fold lactonase family protein [Nitrososphaeraceae archaeon]|nr:beta-propeller fold lactonase family protein [Nitrososphaeraceae archaeon]